MNSIKSTKAIGSIEHRPATFAMLPREIQSMVLKNLIQDIEVDNPRDLSRWSYQGPQASTTSDAGATTILEPHHYRATTTLLPGQRLNSKVKVILRPRLSDATLWRAGQISVLVPRRLLELQASGLFSDRDFVFHCRRMNIEVTSMKVKDREYIFSGPDTPFESLVRDILAQQRELRVYDRRLHAMKTYPSNLACYLPRLEHLEIASDGYTVWGQWYTLVTLNLLLVDLSTLIMLTQQEMADMKGPTHAIPMGMTGLIELRELLLHRFIALPLRRVTRRLAEAGWTGTARTRILVQCVTEGSEGWMNSRLVLLRVNMKFKWNRGWRIRNIEIDEEELSIVANHTWASLGHLNL